MEIAFDPVKSATNLARRGFGFERVAAFDFNSAFIWIDRRQDYGETRFVALGMVETRIYALVYTEISGGIRVISLRKANDREGKLYERNRL